MKKLSIPLLSAGMTVFFAVKMMTAENEAFAYLLFALVGMMLTYKLLKICYEKRN